LKIQDMTLTRKCIERGPWIVCPLADSDPLLDTKERCLM